VGLALPRRPNFRQNERGKVLMFRCVFRPSMFHSRLSLKPLSKSPLPKNFRCLRCPSIRMGIEADICGILIAPELQGAGRENTCHSIARQRIFNEGCTVVQGNKLSPLINKGKANEQIL
jgi:hypothetical protein